MSAAEPGAFAEPWPDEPDSAELPVLPELLPYATETPAVTPVRVSTQTAVNVARMRDRGEGCMARPGGVGRDFSDRP